MVKNHKITKKQVLIFWLLVFFLLFFINYMFIIQGLLVFIPIEFFRSCFCSGLIHNFWIVSLLFSIQVLILVFFLQVFLFSMTDDRIPLVYYNDYQIERNHTKSIKYIIKTQYTFHTSNRNHSEFHWGLSDFLQTSVLYNTLPSRTYQNN